MIANSFSNLNTSVQSMPVAMAFPTQQLLTQNTSVTSQSSSASDEVMESLTIRATRLTSTLEEIEGYDHSGLNE
jgi:hypothetical protein